MLARLSKPMKAKKAMKAPESTPDQAGASGGIRLDQAKLPEAARPTATATTRPMISMAPMAAASPTLSRTPSAAMPANSSTRPAVSAAGGSGSSRAR